MLHLPRLLSRRKRLAVAPRYWVMADQAVVSATTFLTNIFIARCGGLAVFGAYSAWQLVLLLGLTVQGALISQPLPVVYGETTAAHRPAYVRAVVVMQLAFSGLAVAVVAGALAALRRPLVELPAFAVCLVAAGAQDTLRKLLLAEAKAAGALLADCISGGLQVLALAVGGWRSTAFSVEAILWVVGLTTLPALVVAGWALGVQPGPTRLRFFAQRHSRQARWLLPTAALQWTAANGLLVFAGFSGPPATLGVLRLAQTLMGVFNVGLQAVENYALPRLSRSFHHDPAAFGRQRAALARTLLLLGVPALGLLFVLADPVVRWLQPAGAPYAGVVQWCCGLYLAILVIYPLRLTVRLVGEGRHYFIGYALSLGVSVLAARPLVAQWQARGIVMGWLLAQLILGAYWAWAVRTAARPKPALPVEPHLSTAL